MEEHRLPRLSNVQPINLRNPGVQAVRRSTQEQLQALSQAEAGSACSSWLGQLAQDIQKHCPAPMAACASAAHFASLEEHLQTAISQWQPPRQPVTQGTPPPLGGLSACIARNYVMLFHISVGGLVYIRTLLIVGGP